METPFIFLYIVWLGIPIFYFGIALWGYLERISGRRIPEDLGFLFKQGIFTLICWFIALGIDYYYLQYADFAFLPDFIPMGVFRVVLFPFVMLVAGKAVGPTNPIKISKAPGVGGGNPRKKGR